MRYNTDQAERYELEKGHPFVRDCFFGHIRFGALGPPRAFCASRDA
jgi:hypothetical protein